MSDEDRLLSEKYNGVKTPDFDTDCIRLKRGEPLSYVIGWTPFLECRIYLDSRPLIPRPETEWWVEEAISVIRENENPKVLDLFAGSGAIGIAILTHVTNARVDFGEIDTSHFPTIQKNITENGIDSARTQIFETDVWSNISDTYDFILANPPYIAKERIGRVQDSVLLHEPHLALFAENDGYRLIEETLSEARAHLQASGRLFIEHEPEQAERILASGKEAGFTVENKKDQYGVLRYSVLSVVA